MKYLDLFSGIGGFTLGIQQAYDMANRHKEQGQAEVVLGTKHQLTGEFIQGTPTCIGYSEIDKYATQIYQKHFPSYHNYGDITKIKAEDLPEFDLIVGGFPCQSFSIAGKRGGFADTRGTLFFDIARIIKAKQPRLLLLENVKGLLSHDKGDTFRTIIATLDELGYDLQWQVLNSKNFGVPQNRERVFIVGHLRGTPRPKVFPIGQGDKVDDQVREVEDKEGARSSCLNTRYSQRWTDETYIRVPEATKKGYAEATVGQSINLSVPNSKTKRGRVSDVAQTIDTGMQQHTLTKDMKIRRLTPLECERLQGFPDNWTQGISDTQRYKCCGNAVTVNVIQAIMERL